MISLAFLDGKITFDELSLIDHNDIKNHLDSLKEDLLQVEYPKNTLIDVGWYPSFDPNGAFQVRIIKDFQWDSPQTILIANSPKELTKVLLKAQNIISQDNTIDH